MLLSVAAEAQNSSIAGLVKDSSGGVLPGVTVEAASPALIEKVRTAITDSEGLYRITDLRPGTYTVTLTLTGFSAYRREALELTSGFTATVNADLSVGRLEETVTVSGQSPAVDISNVQGQAVLSRETLTELPTARTVRSYGAVMIPGAVMSATSLDVGGNKGDAATSFSVHGGRDGDMVASQDGMRFTPSIPSGWDGRASRGNSTSSTHSTPAPYSRWRPDMERRGSSQRRSWPHGS